MRITSASDFCVAIINTFCLHPRIEIYKDEEDGKNQKYRKDVSVSMERGV